MPQCAHVTENELAALDKIIISFAHYLFNSAGLTPVQLAQMYALYYEGPSILKALKSGDFAMAK